MAAGEVLRSTGGYSTSLRFDNSAWRECIDCWLTLWGIKMHWSCSLADPNLVPWRMKQLDCFRQLFIAPVSNVTCN